jgi:hypothetical protein
MNALRFTFDRPLPDLVRYHWNRNTPQYKAHAAEEEEFDPLELLVTKKRNLLIVSLRY